MGAHANTEGSFGQEYVPISVGDHGQRLIKRTQDLLQGIAAGPGPQATPKRWARFEVISITLEAMGSATRLCMCLKHQDVTTGPCAECTTTQTTDSTSNHNHVDLALQLPTPTFVIIVVSAGERCADVS